MIGLDMTSFFEYLVNLQLLWNGISVKHDLFHEWKLSNLNSTACHLGQADNEFQAQNNRMEQIRFTHNSILVIGLHRSDSDYFVPEIHYQLVPIYYMSHQEYICTCL
jgi:hypothetical protein